MINQIYAKMGQQFPLRSSLFGMADSLELLDYLVNNYQPVINSDTNWQIVSGKVKTRDPNFWNEHPYGPFLGATEWDLDKVIDYYTESSRIASPGYGEEYAPQDLWDRKMLQRFRSRTPEDLREEINKEIQEARLAYVTAGIGLYQRLLEHLPDSSTSLFGSSTPKTALDISAFGDRMVAALNQGIKYTGIDPDHTLTTGISKLKLDLEKVMPDTGLLPITYALPIEGFWSKDKFDIITLSPPPFDAEPYSGGEMQTHRMYPNFNAWFNGFVREMLTRCSQWIKPDGVLAFSVLDRIPRPNENKITMIYTEAMILTAESLGFEFIEIFGLGTKSKTPWWIFRYRPEALGPNSIRKQDISFGKLIEFYPQFTPTIPPVSPLLEYVRHLVNGYINQALMNLEQLPQGLNERAKQKAKDQFTKLLGQLLMSRMESTGDPFFIDPETDLSFEEFDKFHFKKLQLVLQSANSSYYSYVAGKNTQEFLVNVYGAAASFMRWVYYTVPFQRAITAVGFWKEGQNIYLGLDKADSPVVVPFLRRNVPFAGPLQIEERGNKLVLWKALDLLPQDNTVFAGLPLLRYDTLGLVGNHFTRPIERIQLMERASGEPVIDLFATPFNANSKYYGSVYPDVDTDSLGNFFEIKFDRLPYSTFLANPPDYPGFIGRVAERLGELLRREPITFFVGTVLWTVSDPKYPNNDSEYIEQIRRGVFPEFPRVNSRFTNELLAYIWHEIPRKYLKAVYFLDKRAFPSLDPYTQRKFERDATESVGVILSSKPNWEYDSELEQLGPIAFPGPKPPARVRPPRQKRLDKRLPVTRQEPIRRQEGVGRPIKGTSKRDALNWDFRRDPLDISVKRFEPSEAITANEGVGTIDASETIDDIINESETIDDSEISAAIVPRRSRNIFLTNGDLDLARFDSRDLEPLFRVLSERENINAHGRPWTLKDISEMINWNQKHPEDLFWVILNQGKVQGYIGFTPISSRKPPSFAKLFPRMSLRGNILEVYLSKQAQHKGWFKRLFPDILRKTGLNQIFASTYNWNTPAQKAFKRVGMTEVRKGQIREGQAPVVVFYYEKQDPVKEIETLDDDGPTDI